MVFVTCCTCHFCVFGGVLFGGCRQDISWMITKGVLPSGSAFVGSASRRGNTGFTLFKTVQVPAINIIVVEYKRPGYTPFLLSIRRPVFILFFVVVVVSPLSPKCRFRAVVLDKMLCWWLFCFCGI